VRSALWSFINATACHQRLPLTTCQGVARGRTPQSEPCSQWRPKILGGLGATGIRLPRGPRFNRLRGMRVVCGGAPSGAPTTRAAESPPSGCPIRVLPARLTHPHVLAFWLGENETCGRTSPARLPACVGVLAIDAEGLEFGHDLLNFWLIEGDALNGMLDVPVVLPCLDQDAVFEPGSQDF
jgi:hypothetical protein